MNFKTWKKENRFCYTCLNNSKNPNNPNNWIHEDNFPPVCQANDQNLFTSKIKAFQCPLYQDEKKRNEK